MTGDPGEPVRGRTILVVDDSAANRYSLARMLQVAGFEVIECSSGSQALQADLRKVSAVVLDVNLPDVHGFEVCRLLRAGAASAHLPIVHVSAIHVSGEDLLAGLAAGADAYYTSPVDPQVLTATLRSLIQARTLARSLEDRVQLFRGAFDCAPCALAVFDGNGRFAHANAAFAHLLGATSQSLLRRSLLGLVPREWAARAETAIGSWGARPWHGRFPVIHPSGVRMLLEWDVAPHATPTWSVAHVRVVAA